MRNSSFLLAFATILSLGLTACADDPMTTPAQDAPNESSQSPTPEQSEDPDLPSDDDVETVISAIAASSSSDLNAAKDLVEEESQAANYLTYYLHNVNAQIDAGMSNQREPADFQEIENGFEMCETYDGERQCTTYTDFEGKDGLVTNFKVQDRDLSERLIVGSGETVAGPDGSEIEFIAAYMNAYDTDLFIAYNFRSGSSESSMPTVSYRSEEGRQSQSEQDYGAWTLAPDSMSSYIATFPGAQLGGEVHLDIWAENDYGTVVLPTNPTE